MHIPLVWTNKNKTRRITPDRAAGTKVLKSRTQSGREFWYILQIYLCWHVVALSDPYPDLLKQPKFLFKMTDIIFKELRGEFCLKIGFSLTTIQLCFATVTVLEAEKEIESELIIAPYWTISWSIETYFF